MLARGPYGLQHVYGCDGGVICVASQSITWHGQAAGRPSDSAREPYGLSLQIAPVITRRLPQLHRQRHAVRLKPDTTAHIASWGGPDCADLRSMPFQALEIARSEFSAATPDRVHTGAWITTEGPIAPDGPSRELAHSRRVGERRRVGVRFPGVRSREAQGGPAAARILSRLKPAPTPIVRLKPDTT